jgi:hypothetical protein
LNAAVCEHAPYLYSIFAEIEIHPLERQRLRHAESEASAHQYHQVVRLRQRLNVRLEFVRRQDHKSLLALCRTLDLNELHRVPLNRDVFPKHSQIEQPRKDVPRSRLLRSAELALVEPILHEDRAHIGWSHIAEFGTDVQVNETPICRLCAVTQRRELFCIAKRAR